MTQPQPYPGTPDAPYPPLEGAWHPVPATDREARQRAHALVDQLAPYHYVDEARGAGVVRYFAYETAFGRSVSALACDAGGGSLGATNPSFVAPTAAQVQATPPGDALANAAVAMLSDFSANGVPSEHISAPSVVAMQTAWNADPLGQLNGANGQLQIDGGYGPNVAAALASIDGGTAPPVNTSGGGTTPLVGQTTSEPTPDPDATCTAWAADTSNPQAMAIASSIAFHNSPVAWVDQGDYSTQINGVDYLFVFWWEKGLKAVAAYKCTAGSAAGGGAVTPATAAASSSSAAPAVIVGTLVVGALVATGFAARRPIMAALHRRHA